MMVQVLLIPGSYMANAIQSRQLGRGKCSGTIPTTEKGKGNKSDCLKNIYTFIDMFPTEISTIESEL